MKTDNRDSEKDLNANPDSRLNTNKPRQNRFPESQQAGAEMEKREHPDKDDDIELLAGEVKGTVSSRDTSSDPEDIAGVSDLDQGMHRARRKK
ncbi:MAG TPA: hypothetical protein VFO54_10945 [Chryseosolibacter sp.]|nr:hypothetical protein [Chryseosolibacter sp.]